MGKVSVSVDVPAIGQCNNFSVPSTMAVKDVVTLMANILASEYGVSSSPLDLMLFGKDDAKALKNECSLSQLGVSDGAKLILI